MSEHVSRGDRNVAALQKRKVTSDLIIVYVLCAPPGAVDTAKTFQLN